MQRQIGDYVLLEQLGYGSLGKTYLSEHRLLKKRYILKLLPEELGGDPSFVDRFETQVAKLSQLNHPHIAKICNALSIDGMHALVSEVVPDAVSVHLASLGEEQILDLIRKLGSALDQMHSSGLYHGSIKCSNILLQSVNGNFHPFWTDLGLSTIINPAMVLARVYHYIAESLECGCSSSYKSGHWDAVKESALSSSFCSRFFFLAPEQKIEGIIESDFRAADRYALGVLIYFLLTSEYPQGAFPTPSEKVPSLKYNWDHWILSLLNPDPLLRPANIAETLEEEVVYKRQVMAVDRMLKPQEALSSATLLKPVLKAQELQRPSFDADPGAVFQIDTTISQYKPLPRHQESNQIEPLFTEMVVLPEGTYVRGGNHGAKDEMPRHAVTLNAFAIDVHPVTNEQFARFLEVLGGEKDAQNNDIIRLKDSRIKRTNGKVVIEAGYDTHPVVGITWYGALAYAKWVGKRLPTEAEWEVAACSGREDAMYPSGVEIDKTQANFFSSDTTPVCSYPPNRAGLYDMAGNVYEWCQDWYDYHYYDVSVQDPNYPKGPQQGVYRVLRGGCWKSSKEDLRCAHRHRNNPGALNGTYGFRCAADVSS